jgi:hypothetical protein
MPVEPLDPATLAHLYALPPYRLTKAEVRILVAVARDHARLTAENAALRSERAAARAKVAVLRTALASAEAGDTDGD